MKKTFVLLLILAPFFSRSQLIIKSLQSSHGRIGFYEFKPPGYRADSTYKYPLIIFMHGVGERGNGDSDMWMVLNTSFPKMLKNGATLTFNVNGEKHAFLVLMPQMSKEYINWQNFYVEEMIRYARTNLPIDTNKIFLTGWSLGGGGAWKFPTASIDSAKLVAGIIPVAPAPNYTDVCNLAKGRVAVWAHQSKDDPSIPIAYTMDAVKGTNNCGPEIPARMSYYKYGKHAAVSYIAYDTGNTYIYPNIYQWMLGTSRSQRRATNKPPVAHAGRDTTLILPSVKVRLNGLASVDPDGVITGYRWDLVSGPPSPELKIRHADFPEAEVSGLEPGVYRFRLTVADAYGATTADESVVTVTLPPDGSNARPFVDCGGAKAVFRGTAAFRALVKDFDGKVIACEWKQLSGPAELDIKADMGEASMSNFRDTGKYTILVTAKDNGSPAAISADTLTVFRKPFLTPFKTYWSLDSSWQDLYGKAIMIVIFLSIMLATIYSLVKPRKISSIHNKFIINTLTKAGN